jgi:hypothetical protein
VIWMLRPVNFAPRASVGATRSSIVCKALGKQADPLWHAKCFS